MKQADSVWIMSLNTQTKALTWIMTYIGDPNTEHSNNRQVFISYSDRPVFRCPVPIINIIGTQHLDLSSIQTTQKLPPIQITIQLTDHLMIRQLSTIWMAN